jgi:hypothetical protein
LQCCSVTGEGAEFVIEIPICQQVSPLIQENRQLVVVNSQ